MNSFNFTDIDKNAGVTLDAPLYYLRINETYDTPHYAAKAKARLLKMMENIRKNYPTVSFMIIFRLSIKPPLLLMGFKGTSPYERIMLALSNAR